MKLLFNKTLQISFLLSASLYLAACNDSSTGTATNDSTAGKDSSMASGPAVAMATLSGTKTDTTVNGTVEFRSDASNKVKMTLDITVPKKANSSVAVHIHQMGDCGEMGNHAGGHWNPTGKNHGKWGSDNFHSGDIGNITLDGEGKGHLELESDLWSIGGDEKTNILDKTIIVHSGVDDYTSQPAGNSGSRIGCGVIKKG